MSNILDTRDLQERLEKLRGLKDVLHGARAALEELEEFPDSERDESWKEKQNDAQTDLDNAEAGFGEEAQDELDELEGLADEIPEWAHGNQLITEEDFEDYCQELCEDIAREIPAYIVIDWEATASNLRMDYSECEYQGGTYLYRNC